MKIKTLLIVCLLFLVACSSNDDPTETKATSGMIDKGLAAVSNNDLGKAEGIFESEPDNETAQIYYQQVVLIRSGQELLAKGKIEEAIATFEEVSALEGGSMLITQVALQSIEEASKATEPKEKDENVVKEPEPKQEIKVEVISDAASGMKYVQLVDSVGNIREQPTKDSKLVHKGKKGDVFVYLQEKINTPDGRTWYKIEYGSGTVGYISRAISTLSNEAPSYVRLLENGTNIRNSPDVKASVIYKGQLDDTFYFSHDKTYTQDGRTWLHVWLPDGQYGYVSQKVATMTTAYTPTVQGNHYGSYIVTTVKNANIRSYPSIDSSYILEDLNVGERFKYTGYYYNTSDGRTWYEVQVGNKYGYISKAVSKIQ